MCRDVLDHQETDFFVYPAVMYYKDYIVNLINKARERINKSRDYKIRVYNNEKIEIEEILLFFNDLESEFLFRWYLTDNAEKIKKAYEDYKNIFLQDAQRYKNLDYFFYGIDD